MALHMVCLPSHTQRPLLVIAPLPELSGTLEAGHIYFLYRPKIDVDDVESVDDVSK